MTDEIDLAFAHPEARARAIADPAVADRISLRDYVVAADIGAFQQERGAVQRLRFNVVVEVGAAARGAGDDVDRILSYDRITDAIAAALADERLNLLETLAESVAADILAHPLAVRVILRVEKLDRGPGALGVEILRTVGAASATAPATVAMAPSIIVAEPEGPAITAPATPTVYVARPGATGTLPRDPALRRRIELLAADQAAWRLSARIAQCTVVATRTELDWALARGMTVVWAPSKMVLDTVGAPDLASVTGPALAAWLGAVTG